MTATLVSFTLKIDVSVAMLYIFSYAFLLRVPSEGLPAEVGHVGDVDTPLPPGRHSRLGMRGAELVLQLAKRKNRPHGSTIIRACWCSKCETTCPIHVLARWLETFREGECPFAHISPQIARRDLKNRLEQIGIAEAHSYWLHDFRRGHTNDLTQSGSSLVEVLKAGEWKTPAFLDYVNLQRQERDAVIQAHLDESSSDSDNS
jgi:hypothetical protein